MSAPTTPSSPRSEKSVAVDRAPRVRNLHANPNQHLHSHGLQTLSPLSAERESSFTSHHTSMDLNSDPLQCQQSDSSSTECSSAPHDRLVDPIARGRSVTATGSGDDTPHSHLSPPNASLESTAYYQHFGFAGYDSGGTCVPFSTRTTHLPSPTDRVERDRSFYSPVRHRDADVLTEAFQRQPLRCSDGGRIREEGEETVAEETRHSSPVSSSSTSATSQPKEMGGEGKPVRSAPPPLPPSPAERVAASPMGSGSFLDDAVRHATPLHGAGNTNDGPNRSPVPVAQGNTTTNTSSGAETLESSASRVPLMSKPPKPTLHQNSQRPTQRSEFQKMYLWNGLPSSYAFEAGCDDTPAKRHCSDSSMTFVHLSPVHYSAHLKNEENIVGSKMYGSSDFDLASESKLECSPTESTKLEKKKRNVFYTIVEAYKGFRKNLKSWTWEHIIWIIVLLLLVSIGNFLQIIMLNFWLSSFPASTRASNYTVFALPGVIFFVFFLVVQIVHLIVHRPRMSFAKSWRGNWLLFLVGMTDSVNSWMAAYAATYTSEVLQALFMNLSPIYAVFLSKWILRDDRKYLNRSIVSVFVLTILGVFIVTVYTMVKSPSFGEIAWICIFFLSIPLRVVMNVWQSLYMIVYTYDSEFNEWLERKYVEEEVENSIRQQHGDVQLSQKKMRKRRRLRKKKAAKEHEAKTVKLNKAASGSVCGSGSGKTGPVHYNTSEEFTMSITAAEGFSGTFSAAQPADISPLPANKSPTPLHPDGGQRNRNPDTAAGGSGSFIRPVATGVQSISGSHAQSSGRRLRRRMRRSYLDLNLTQMMRSSLTNIPSAREHSASRQDYQNTSKGLGRRMSSSSMLNSTTNQLFSNHSDGNLHAAGGESSGNFVNPAHHWSASQSVTAGVLREEDSGHMGDKTDNVKEGTRFSPQPHVDNFTALKQETSAGAFSGFPSAPTPILPAPLSGRWNKSQQEGDSSFPHEHSRALDVDVDGDRDGGAGEEYEYTEEEYTEEVEEAEKHGHELVNRDPCSSLEGAQYYRELDASAIHDVLRSGASEVVFRGEEQDGNRVLHLPVDDGEGASEILDLQRHPQEPQRRRQGRFIGMGTGIQLGMNRRKSRRPYDPARQATPFQKHYRELQEREGDDTSVKAFMLATGTFWQLVITLALLPADALPWFGSSRDVRNTWVNFMEGIECVFTKKDNTLYGFLYTLGFVFNYLGAAYLNHYSVALCSIVTQLSSPFTALVLVIIPSWNKHPEDSPPWFLSMVSIFFLSVAALIYVLWEEKTDEEKKDAEMQLKRYKLKL